MNDDTGGENEGPTRRSLLERGTRQLKEAGRDAPRRTAEWMLLELCGCNRAGLYAYPEAPVDRGDVHRFEAMVQRRVQGEPLQHILGYDEFYGLRLAVSPDVLVPRPETEELVEHALRLIGTEEAPRVLDAGTGSGCIALAIKSERSDALVHACDVSADALAVAAANAERLNLNVNLRLADMLDDAFPDQVPGALDLLIANPPYVPDQEAESLPEEVRAYDPPLALFAGDDPLRFYRALARHAEHLLAPGGHFVVETHADYAHDVAGLLADSGLTGVHVKSDLAGRPRIATARRNVDD